MAKLFSRADVAKHNQKGDNWIIIDTKVYDISKFAGLHPGGEYILYDKDIAGQDTTETFFGLHRSEVLEKYKRLQVGTIKDEKPEWILPSSLKGQLSRVPFAEPLWLSPGYKSSLFTESHVKLQQWLRKFVDEVIRPEAVLHEQTDKRPSVELIKKMGTEEGGFINHMRLGPGPHLKGLTLPGGLKGENFTYLHELVLNQEMARIGARGYADGFQGGVVISLPTIANFGSKKLQEEWIGPVLAGDKFTALAVSEAFAGSDVARLATTARKSEDGKRWIIRGTKKWITGGHFADGFSVACKTGDNQLTMIFVPRLDGVDTKQMSTSYSKAAGTAYVTFDDVEVPIENTLGKEGRGIIVVLSNFNHERWVMCCASARSTRLFIEQAFVWAHVRKVFGKRLIDQPVIRQKFSILFGQIEAGQSWLENVTFQMTQMNYNQQSDLLAGQIALLKQFLTRVAHHAADECVQIFGGRGITKTGMGSLVEGFQRTQKFDAILGGTEEILGDLAVRRAMMNKIKVAL